MGGDLKYELQTGKPEVCRMCHFVLFVFYVEILSLLVPWPGLPCKINNHLNGIHLVK